MWVKALNSKRDTVFHIIFWILFILHEIGSLFYVTRKLEPLKIYFLYYGLNICFFYIQAELLTYLSQQVRLIYLKGFLFIILLFIFYLFFKSIVDFFLATSQPNFLEQLRHTATFIVGNINRGLYFSLLSAFYWATGHIGRYRKKVNNAEKQRLLILQEKSNLELRLGEARNAYLQQQINPHLLFNTLNFVYGSVYKYSNEAARAVWLLAEIMRFSMEETRADGTVEMAREVEQLHHLLEINRYRFNKELFIRTTFLGNFSLYRIIPLVLLTLTENLFKHGNLADAGSPAVLNISVDANGKLYYYCRNLKKVKSKYPQNSRIGLQNLRIRLDYSYEGKYILNILEDDKHFELTLNLFL